MSTGLVSPAVPRAVPEPMRSLRVRTVVVGALYIVNIAGCLFSEGVVRGGLIARGDAAATAGHLVAHAQLFRAGVAAELAAVACFVAAAALLCEILTPVSRSVSLLAALFGTLEGAVHSVNLLAQLAALVPLGGAAQLAAFTPGQLQALAYAAIDVRTAGFQICMVFFGLYFLTLGWLAFRSTFLPRVLGVALGLAGVSCLAGGFATLLAPAFAGPLFAYFLAPFGLGRVFLAVWFLAKGVDGARWQALARGDGARR